MAMAGKVKRCWLTWAAWGTGVVARVRRRGLGDEQLAGARGALRDDVDAAALAIIHDPLALVPVDERRRHRRLHRQAGEIDVAAALDEELRVAQDLGPRHCQTKGDKKPHEAGN